MLSHIFDGFGDLDDPLGAPIGGLQRDDGEVGGGEGGKAGEGELGGAIEKDEVVVAADFGNEID